jgi:hypothetical protein
VVDKTGDRVFNAMAGISRGLSIRNELTNASQEDHECQRGKDPVHDDFPYSSISLLDLFDKRQLVVVLLISERLIGLWMILAMSDLTQR